MIESVRMGWNHENCDLLLKNLIEIDLTSYNVNYQTLLKLGIEYIINRAPEEARTIDFDYGGYLNTEKITMIDDGDYQGTLLFVVPEEVYQPDWEHYFATYVNYGSCSVCDTLLNLKNQLEYEDQTEEAYVGFMQLILHMLQRLQRLYK